MAARASLSGLNLLDVHEERCIAGEVRLFAPVSLERVDGQTGRIVFRVGPGM